MPLNDDATDTVIRYIRAALNEEAMEAHERQKKIWPSTGAPRSESRAAIDAAIAEKPHAECLGDRLRAARTAQPGDKQNEALHPRIYEIWGRRKLDWLHRVGGSPKPKSQKRGPSVAAKR